MAALAAAGTVCSDLQTQDVPAGTDYLATATTCVIGAEKVAVATFTSAEQRSRYLTIGLSKLGAYPHFVMGTTWAVATLTATTASSVAGAIGGDVY